MQVEQATTCLALVNLVAVQVGVTRGNLPIREDNIRETDAKTHAVNNRMVEGGKASADGWTGA